MSDAHTSPVTAQALKGCPFCGGLAAELTEAMGEAWVRCPSCAASAAMSTHAALAVKLWNRRAGVAQQEPKLSEGCILCANGNDLPEGEQCAGCGREGHAIGLRAAVIKARGRSEPPSSPVHLAQASKPPSEAELVSVELARAREQDAEISASEAGFFDELRRSPAQAPLIPDALEAFQKIQGICDSYPMTVYSICSEMIDKLSPVTSTVAQIPQRRVNQPDDTCKDCGLARREHHHEGAAYGRCGQFSEVTHALTIRTPVSRRHRGGSDG